MIVNATDGNFTDVLDILAGIASLEDTDISGDGPLVEVIPNYEEDGEHIGFSIENSLLKIIPKFFKAIVTLLICGLLLGVTFLLISLWKRGCRTHRKLEEDGSLKKSGNKPLHSVIVTPPEDDDEDQGIDTGPSGSNLQPIRPKYMKVPKQAMLRRASGPFGSEALSFIGEQYTMKNIEREGHHHSHQSHQGHGGRMSPLHAPGRSSSPHTHHFHGGASSTGGGSIQHQDIENGQGESSSKWNCFKKNRDP